ncbi:hypothetical protein HDF16_005842 [Granulicella aggregans]|uniref:Uncharacterized protein n=1 Tax=Granulicella aggregans TaxID=474949 RepID=A0A7W7ZKY2_9BACT|nr:hypothetical protein [Granulicella aggregans]
MEPPIPFTAEVQRPLIRLHHLRNIVTAACFKQQYMNIRVLGKTTGDDGAR